MHVQQQVEWLDEALAGSERRDLAGRDFSFHI